MKPIFIILGSLSLALGVLGIFLPLLPTTPFLLLAATLYMHSSPKLYDRLLNNRYLGQYIRNYREHRYIPLRSKIVAITTLWITILYSIFYAANGRPILQILLLIIAIGVTWHLVSLNSRKKG